MEREAIIKFDGCVIRSQDKVEDATIGYQLHTVRDGHLGGKGERVVNEIGVEEIYSTHTEYFALLQGLKYARRRISNPKDYNLRVQGDAISVLKCVDPESETTTSVSHLKIYVDQIQDQFKYFNRVESVDKISSEANPAHHNAKGPLGN